MGYIFNCEPMHIANPSPVPVGLFIFGFIAVIAFFVCAIKNG